jgi:glycosyltransferase involved in cell wall biosynthesis
MRVLLVPNTTASMVWFRRPFLQRLAERGHTTWVAAPEGWGIDRILATGASFLPLSSTQGWSFGAKQGATSSYMNPLRDVDAVRDIRRACRVVRPDLVLSYTHKMTLLAPFAARLAGVPRVHGMITGMGYANLGGTPRREAIRQAYHLSIRGASTFCDSVILLNRDNVDEARRLHLAPGASLYLMDGEGVDMTRFDAPAPTWEAGKATFLLIARMVHHKGVYEYVEAARRLKREFPEARFLLTGSADPKHPDTVDPADLERWKRDGPVEMTGHVDDVRTLLRETSAFVLPSYATEGLPMSIMEAMAMRRPIVTTIAPGNRETVEEGVNGFLVPQRDVDSLTDRLRRFLVDPSLGPAMGEASRARCARRFDHHVVNDALLAHLGL